MNMMPNPGTDLISSATSRRNHSCRPDRVSVFFLALVVVAHSPTFVAAADPAPVLNHVFPAGGQAGQSLNVTLSGDGLKNATAIRIHPGISAEKTGDNTFRLTIEKDVLPGHYDLRAVTDAGLSSPRSFVVSQRSEQIETEGHDLPESAQIVSLNSVVNARIGEAGDIDHFQFTARGGQSIVIECFSERIDSPLRAVLEIYDDSGRRLAVNRGFAGIDPLIHFVPPQDGKFLIRVFDLTYTGGADHVYRLEIDTGPRIAFAVPSVVERGKNSRVRLYGWNLRAGENQIERGTDHGNGKQ